MAFRIGIDIGGTSVKAGIVNEKGEIIVKDTVMTKADVPYIEIIEDIAGLVHKVVAQANLKMSDIENIGVGMPGNINYETGEVIYSNNIAWKNVPLGKELSRLLAKPVKIDNDANVAGYGEFLFGAGKKYSSSIMITLGTGVGAGIVIDGKIFSGFKSAGAELGHVIIWYNGEQCTCGRKGCLEAYASATALIKQTREAMSHNKKSIMWETDNLETASGKTAFEASKAGDKAACEVVNNYIEYLSEGIVNFVNAFRPEAIILGGGVSAQGDYLLNPLKKLCYQKTYGGIEYAPYDILIATLGNDAGIVGAAFL